jgi:hypothetical protein
MHTLDKSALYFGKGEVVDTNALNPHITTILPSHHCLYPRSRLALHALPQTNLKFQTPRIPDVLPTRLVLTKLITQKRLSYAYRVTCSSFVRTQIYPNEP